MYTIRINICTVHSVILNKFVNVEYYTDFSILVIYLYFLCMIYVSYIIDEFNYKNLKSYLVYQQGEKYSINLAFHSKLIHYNL